MQQLAVYHPLSQKADLMVSSAKAGLLEAKGASTLFWVLKIE